MKIKQCIHVHVHTIYMYTCTYISKYLHFPVPLKGFMKLVLESRIVRTRDAKPRRFTTSRF